MNKSSIQKKFRFIMVISALCLFITIFTPAYIRYGSNAQGYPRVVWMWTVLFGAGGGALLNNVFNFSWIAFIGYSLVLILLIIELIKKFITVDSDDKKKNSNISFADASGVICSLLSLVMFVLLPITITSASMEPAGEYVIDYYGIGISYILAYIILVVMVVSSFIVLYADSIVKYMKIKEKKQQKEVKDTKKEIETNKVKEEKEENKDETNE